MSSHLLGEIERACDNLVVIDGGKLMRSDTIASFTSSMQVLTVEVDAGEDELADRLTGHGFTVGRDGRLLLIAMDGGEPYDVLRDEVVDMGVGLIRLEQRRHRLEDLFRAEEAVEELVADV
jgi:ABC-2 type transport system ATP-binding protein